MSLVLVGGVLPGAAGSSGFYDVGPFSLLFP